MRTNHWIPIWAALLILAPAWWALADDVADAGADQMVFDVEEVVEADQAVAPGDADDVKRRRARALWRAHVRSTLRPAWSMEAPGQSVHAQRLTTSAWRRIGEAPPEEVEQSAPPVADAGDAQVERVEEQAVAVEALSEDAEKLEAERVAERKLTSDAARSALVVVTAATSAAAEGARSAASALAVEREASEREAAERELAQREAAEREASEREAEAFKAALTTATSTARRTLAGAMASTMNSEVIVAAREAAVSGQGTQADLAVGVAVAMASLDTPADTPSVQGKTTPTPVSPGRGGLSEEDRGSLHLPLIFGHTIETYGAAPAQRRAKDKTRHTGWTIDAPARHRIRVAADGQVVYARPYKGFGLVVIVDHGGGYHSVYARLQTIIVNENTRLKHGDPIGLLLRPNQKTPKRAQLYFELRHHGSPIDPEGWFLPASALRSR